MSLRDSVLEDEFDEDFPVESEGFGRYGDFELVGHGKVTNDNCGRFSSYYGCVRAELHDKVLLSGENCKGKVYVRVHHHSCNNPRCPVCYKYGWASREAGKIELRLAEASKRFGLVEHIIVGVPSKFWGLSFEALRLKAIQALAVRDVIGGVLIFHGFRYNNADEARRKHVLMGWYWSPHFHVLGFIIGGYGKCRGCPKCVKGCGGFVDRNYRLNESDGFYLKVLGKRKTVGGTAWYQLNHASIKAKVRRFHVATWFGVCSYRRLKVKVERKRNVCPICEHDLVKLLYHGSKSFKSGMREFVVDLVEDDRVVWVEDVRRSGG